MQMAGVRVVEIADLAAMKRADIDKIKAFITRKVRSVPPALRQERHRGAARVHHDQHDQPR